MKQMNFNTTYANNRTQRSQKAKILSRIQQQLNRKEGEESMTHMKYDEHNKVNQYSKGAVPTFPIPE